MSSTGVRFSRKTANHISYLAALLLISTLSFGFAGCAGVVSGSNSAGSPGALAISNVQPSTPTSTGFQVSWSTNIAANSAIDYGTSASYGGSTPVNNTMVTSHQMVVSGLTTGTLYHFRVRSADASNNLAVSSDMTFATTGDTTAPTVSITSPGANATLSGTVNVAVTATDNVGVSSVQLKIDNANSGAPATAAPYVIAVNTVSLSNGNHILTAVASDAAGNSTTSAQVAVKVSNTNPDTTPPTVSISAPANGATVSGTVSISANASDNVGVASVQFQLDGANFGSLDTASPYSVSWNTTTSSNGSHTVRAIAKDAAGNSTTSAAVTVTVSNSTTDTTPPTVSINAPANGATVSGTVSVTANASDNVGVASVQFQLDGANLGSLDMTAPYSVSWTTTSATNAAHTLRAIAKDAAGNSTTSAAVTVTVNNGAPDTTPPSVPTSLSASALSSSQISLTWKASTDNVGVTGYNVFRGGAKIGTSATASYIDNGLTASTSYTYNVSAFDAAGNTSAQSGAASATTQASSGGGGIPSALGWWPIPNSQQQPVCSPDQNVQGNTGCAAVISAWSGGIADTKRNRLVFWGGGHSDYYGNEVYALDLNSLQMLRLNNPSDPAGSCTPAAPDGKPTARHTYGGLAYLSDFDSMYVFGGALACSGGQDSNDTWMLNFANLQWTRKDPTNGGSGNGLSGLYDGKFAAYDPVNKLAYANDAFSFWSFNPATNVYTNLNTGPVSVGGLMGEIDPVRRMFIVFGRTTAYSLNLTTGVLSDWSNSTSGCSSLVNNDYPGLAYDSSRGLMVGWVGGNTVYEFNPDTKSCNAVTWPNGPGAAQNNGTFGRFRYFPALNVFAVVNDWQENAYTLRLTSGGNPSGPVISAVSASAITTNSFTVNWTTDVAATSQVDYGTTTAYGTSTTLNSSLVTGHSVALSGLQTGTLYHYRVRSKNSGGTESISGDFAVTTNNTVDTTPPTVSITAPSSGATVASTLTIAANASDNVGVTGVQFFVDGTAIGTPLTSSPYSIAWDSNTVSNASHSLTATARDAAGNTATSAAVTVTVNNASTGNALQDFQQRCAAAGVLVCEGFDSPSDFTPAVSPASGLYPSGSGLYKGTMDTAVTASGAGSLRYEIDGMTSANSAGFWRQMFGQDFGENSTFYVQYRFRISDTMLQDFGDTSGNTGWKFSIFHNGGVTCGSAEITATETSSNVFGLPGMYGDCGAMGFGTWPAPPNQQTIGYNPPYYKQQGDTATTGYNCQYGTNYATNPACFIFRPFVWYTFYYKVHIGDLTTNGSNGTCKGCFVQSWVGAQGQPLKEWINAAGVNFDDTMPPYNSVDLLNYMTGKDPSLNHPTAFTWYDELIVSSQPIAAPKF